MNREQIADGIRRMAAELDTDCPEVNAGMSRSTLLDIARPLVERYETDERECPFRIVGARGEDLREITPPEDLAETAPAAKTEAASAAEAEPVGIDHVGPATTEEDYIPSPTDEPAAEPGTPEPAAPAAEKKEPKGKRPKTSTPPKGNGDHEVTAAPPRRRGLEVFLRDGKVVGLAAGGLIAAAIIVAALLSGTHDGTPPIQVQQVVGTPTATVTQSSDDLQQQVEGLQRQVNQQGFTHRSLYWKLQGQKADRAVQ